MTHEEAVAAAYKEGQLDQRLAGFDTHFAAINGSVERTAEELSKLRIALETRLGEKVDRSRMHELIAEIAADKLKSIGEVSAIKLELGTRPAALLALKQEMERDIQTVRDELSIAKFGGSLRRWAAAGSAFAVAFGIVLGIAHQTGLL